MTTDPSISNGTIQFIHPHGQVSVLAEVSSLLGSGNRLLRGAVCFLTEPGRVLLSRHRALLNLPDSFFVASVAKPTNLDSMLRLHRQAPKNIYIHLGGRTPEEKRVGRSLMHSKVFLAEGTEESRLWVGSHNLTAMAIEGGNIEAGVKITGSASSAVMIDAAAHLDVCRNTAELFDPSQMDRYRDIQNGWTRDSEWNSEKDVLVIHAEAPSPPHAASFIVHVHLVPTKLDRLFNMDRPVRLFLHSSGALCLGKPVDYDSAMLWVGEITAVVRTDLHPKNRGARGQFASANYDIDIPDLRTPPVLMPGGTSCVNPKTQVVIRADRRGETGEELYSIDQKSPLTNFLDCAAELDLHQVSDEMARFFTPESLHGNMLVYRPATQVKQDLKVRGYDETVRAKVPRQSDRPEIFEATERAQYLLAEPRNPIDPFFFLSKHLVRPRRDE